MLSCGRPAVLWGHVVEGGPSLSSHLAAQVQIWQKIQLAPEGSWPLQGSTVPSVATDPGSHFLHHHPWLVTPVKVAGDENTVLFSGFLKQLVRMWYFPSSLGSSRTFHISALRLHREAKASC